MKYQRLSAAEYFSKINNEDDFFLAKGDFLDDFYSANDDERIRMISQPLPKELITVENRRYAAYFAGMIEYLCVQYHLDATRWLQDVVYRLPEPWFLYENWRFRAWQLVMTPPAFISRNIFTGDDPVSRV